MKKSIKELTTTKETNPVAVVEQDILPPEMTKLLEDKLPQWVKELARDGTAVLRWNLEFLILIEEILRREYGMNQADMVKIEKRVKELMPHLHKMQLEGLTILKAEDMKIALNIVDLYKQQLEREGQTIALANKDQVRALGGKIKK